MKKIGNFFKNIWVKFKSSDFYKTYKEEIIVIPIIILIFYLVNTFLITIFPDGAFFDFASNMETIFYKILMLFLTLFFGHFALRISFPTIYKEMHEDIYDNFSNIEESKKIKIEVLFIIVFLIISAIIFS
jgi:hypothetical protein